MLVACGPGTRLDLKRGDDVSRRKVRTVRRTITRDRAAASDSAFAGAQYDAAYPPGIERSFWHRARNATILRWLRKFRMETGSLLEIGCGRGNVVDYLRQSGVDCIGCDLAAIPVPHHLSGKLFAATDFRDLPPALRAEVRGVLLCDVIEHLAEPATFLRSLATELPRLERVLLTVPARSELWSAWDEHFGHKRRYRLGMLRRELLVAGLKPLGARYFFHALYPPMYATARFRRPQAHGPRASWLHALVGAAFRVEQALVPPVVPGASIIAVAELRPTASD